MAKKETKKVEVKRPQIQEESVEETMVKEPVFEQPEPKVKNNPLPTPKNDWEVKDRTYILKNSRRPLSYIIKAADIYYFDKEKGYERELKYTKNQRTPFVDEMQGDQRLEHIIFRSGALHVPKNKVTLQKLLSLYHPLRDKLFEELKPAKKATDELVDINLEIDALNVARELDLEMMEGILRVEIGSKVSSMSSKELKRDLLIYAKNNPRTFLSLVQDENVHLRNFGIKAVEAGMLKLSPDQRSFLWASNNRKLMTIPFEEHPYSALAAWFKTDEGMEVFSSIEKRLA